MSSHFILYRGVLDHVPVQGLSEYNCTATQYCEQNSTKYTFQLTEQYCTPLK